MEEESTPAAWKSLRYWWVRGHLIDELDELADPAQTAKWLHPDPNGRILGIDETFHFFFDDHDFNKGSIGIFIFDLGEAEAIKTVTDLLEAILDDPANPKASDYFVDNRYFLTHPKWPLVASAAALARDKLIERGGYVEWTERRHKARVDAAARRAQNSNL